MPRLDHLDSYVKQLQKVRDIVQSTGMARGAAISYDRLEDQLATLQR